VNEYEKRAADSGQRLEFDAGNSALTMRKLLQVWVRFAI